MNREIIFRDSPERLFSRNEKQHKNYEAIGNIPQIHGGSALKYFNK